MMPLVFMCMSSLHWLSYLEIAARIKQPCQELPEWRLEVQCRDAVGMPDEASQNGGASIHCMAQLQLWTATNAGLNKDVITARLPSEVPPHTATKQADCMMQLEAPPGNPQHQTGSTHQQSSPAGARASLTCAVLKTSSKHNMDVLSGHQHISGKIISCA
jgi:hypothetical protein